MLKRFQLKDIGLYIAAFALGFGVIAVALISAGAAPFGDNCPTRWDYYTQYTEYFSWYRRILTSGGSIFYSFDQSLGGNTTGLYAYYLGSPLNLLCVFFSENNILDFMGFLVLLKAGLCSFSCYYYVRKRFDLGALPSFIPAIGYALCQYVAAFSFCGIMWIDALILLPFVALGIYRYVTKRKIALFLASMFLAVVACWYTAYMIFVFSLLFFLYEYCLNEEKIHIKPLLVAFSKFCILVLIAALLSAVILFPVVYAQAGSVDGYFAFLINIEYRPTQLGYALLFGTGNIMTTPEIYCGTIITILAAYFFVSKTIPRRMRFLGLAFLLLMLFCTIETTLAYMWCGFRMPRGYFCRFSFLICFLLVFFAARSLADISKNPPTLSWRIAVPGLVMLALILLNACFTGKMDVFSQTTLFNVVLSIIGLLTLYFIGRYPRAVGIACLVLLSVELGFNYYINYMNISDKNTSTAATEREWHSTEAAKLQSLEESDRSFWRMEKEYSRLEGSLGHFASTCDGLALGYSQLENYSSALSSNLADFSQFLGYSMNDMNSTNYKEKVIPSDSLLGIKYVMNREGGIDQNPYALSLGFIANESVLDGLPEQNTASSISSNTNPTNPFENQNNLFSQILGRDVEVYKPLDPTLTSSSDTAYTWTVDNTDGKLAYAYILTDKIIYSKLSVGGVTRYGDYNYWASQYVFDISNIGDDEIALTLDASAGTQIGNHELLAYYVDMDVFNEAIDELRSQSFNTEIVDEGGFVKGSVYSEDGGLLMTTIPYGDGWHVKVNGKDVNTEKADDTFLAFYVEAGDSTITMTYEAPGLVLGAGVSLVTLAGVIVFTVLRKRKLAQQSAQ